MSFVSLDLGAIFLSRLCVLERRNRLQFDHQLALSVDYDVGSMLVLYEAVDLQARSWVLKDHYVLISASM